jgi:hypothetical protein
VVHLVVGRHHTRKRPLHLLGLLVDDGDGSGSIAWVLDTTRCSTTSLIGSATVTVSMASIGGDGLLTRHGAAQRSDLHNVDDGTPRLYGDLLLVLRIQLHSFLLLFSSISFFSSLFYSSSISLVVVAASRKGTRETWERGRGQVSMASYGAAVDTTHGQFCPATIHGVQALAAMWPASVGQFLGFEGATAGQRGQIPLGGVSEARASAPTWLGVLASTTSAIPLRAHACGT